MKPGKHKVLDLFSGIGGFSLGLERTGGFETVAFCEIEPYCQKVLKKHWPEVPIYEDVKELTGTRLTADGITGINIITGGFPCQDISIVGKQKGIAKGTRSGLWSEVARLTSELRPQFVIVENVANLLRGPSEKRGAWFSRILGDLAEIGYDAEWEVIRADSLDIPQSRPRVWVVAYPSRDGCGEIFYKNTINVAGYRPRMDGSSGIKANANDENYRACAVPILENKIWASIPNRERSGNNERLSSGVDRYKSLGNAVVPQIPEMIGYAIMEAEL